MHPKKGHFQIDIDGSSSIHEDGVRLAFFSVELTCLSDYQIHMRNMCARTCSLDALSILGSPQVQRARDPAAQRNLRLDPGTFPTPLKGDNDLYAPAAAPHDLASRVVLVI